MAAYILKRLAQALVVLTLVVLIIFSLVFISGDPVLLLMPPDASREDIELFRHQMGFDQPIWMQFLQFAGRIVLGDFGTSWRFQQPAMSLVLDRVPVTMQLAISALVLSLVIAVPIGVLSAIKRNSKTDAAAMVFALLGQSVPGFWLGLMLILIFAVHLGWLPTSGRAGPEYIILPALSLGLSLAGRNARLVRSCMLEVLNEDYIRTAHAKGLSVWRVINKHALKNAMLPIVTVVGLELGFLLGGTVVIETVFSWPGIGLLAVHAISGRDYPVVQATILITSTFFVLINLAVDLLYTWLDPRISFAKR